MISVGDGSETYDYDSYELLKVTLPPDSIRRNRHNFNGLGLRTTGVHWRRCRHGEVPKYAVKGGVSEGVLLLLWLVVVVVGCGCCWLL